MRGDLSETPAADACRELAGDGATGVLSIEGPDGPGSVTFVEGRVVGATSPTPQARLGDRLVGAGFLEDEALSDALATQRASSGRSLLGALLVERTEVPRDALRLFVQEQTLDAMFEVLRWRFGTFSFEAGESTAASEAPVAMTVDQVLVEVARRQQQWHELSQVIPDLEAVPTSGTNRASAAASLEPDEVAVLASVDGDRSVRTLAGDLGYGEFELARIVYGLVLLGVVEIELPEDEIGAALDDAMGYLGHPDPVPARPARALTVVPDPVPATERDIEREAPAAAPDPGDEPAAAAPQPGPGPPAAAPQPVRSPPARLDIGPGDEGTPAVSDSAAGLGSVVKPDRVERSYSDVFRELRGLEGDRPTPPPEPASTGDVPIEDAPAEDAPAEDASTEDASTEARGADGETTPRRPARPSDDGDVSEFLRELSRLALGDDPAEPERPRKSPTPPSDPKDEGGKRKRRGLFGRG